MSMNPIDVNGLLAQMRALSAQSGLPQVPAAGNVAPTQQRQDFGALLKQGIAGVEQTQRTAGVMSDAFERGAPGADLGQVMVAVQKADLSFQAMTQVRNKLVDAYQAIMNMQM